MGDADYAILESKYEALVLAHANLKRDVRALTDELFDAVAEPKPAPAVDAGVQRPGEDGW